MFWLCQGATSYVAVMQRHERLFLVVESAYDTTDVIQTMPTLPLSLFFS